jgi:hypothetical protein
VALVILTEIAPDWEVPPAGLNVGCATWVIDWVYVALATAEVAKSWSSQPSRIGPATQVLCALITLQTRPPACSCVSITLPASSVNANQSKKDKKIPRFDNSFIWDNPATAFKNLAASISHAQPPSSRSSSKRRRRGGPYHHRCR